MESYWDPSLWFSSAFIGFESCHFHPENSVLWKLPLFLMKTPVCPDQMQSVAAEVDAVAAACPGSWEQNRLQPHSSIRGRTAFPPAVQIQPRKLGPTCFKLVVGTEM